ncbi:MAG: alanine racemase [Microbacterium sp.]
MTRPLREAVIDAAAITRNTRHLREVAGTREFIAVVKADGYGHGAATAARAALDGGASRLGVATIDEALALRDAGITSPLLCWIHDPHETFHTAAAAELEIGVSRVEQLHALAATGHTFKVHLKLETGLSRNGLAPADWATSFETAVRYEAEGRLTVEGVFSHLSGTSPADDLTQARQLRAALGVASAAGITPTIVHLAATAGAIRLPDARFDAVRVGVGLYGLSPFDDATSADLGLTPAMTLRTRVAAVRRVPAGHGISYGFTARTERETTLALVPLGYADGIPRQASNKGPVRIGGTDYAVTGRVAMDQFVVDVGDAPVQVDDEVVIFGDPAAGAPSAADWGDAAGTINYEIVTRIGPRVARVAP